MANRHAKLEEIAQRYSYTWKLPEDDPLMQAYKNWPTKIITTYCDTLKQFIIQWYANDSECVTIVCTKRLRVDNCEFKLRDYLWAGIKDEVYVA